MLLFAMFWQVPIAPKYRREDRDCDVNGIDRISNAVASWRRLTRAMLGLACGQTSFEEGPEMGAAGPSGSNRVGKTPINKLDRNASAGSWRRHRFRWELSSLRHCCGCGIPVPIRRPSCSAGLTLGVLNPCFHTVFMECCGSDEACALFLSLSMPSR